MEVERRRPQRPEPFHVTSVPAIRTTGRPYRSTSRDATMPITPSCQPAPATTYAAAAAPRLGPRLDLVDRVAQDALLDRLPLAVQALELLGEALGLAGVLGEQQRERRLRPAQPARRVDARGEPEADRRLVDVGRSTPATRISARSPGFCVCASRRSPSERERAVLVDERDDVGDRRERDDVEVPVEERMLRPEQRLRELPDDAGAAEAR